MRSGQGQIEPEHGRRNLPGLAQTQRDGERQPASGGVAGDRDAARIDALRDEPAVGGERVVDRGGVRVFRAHAVVERDHARVRGGADRGDERATRAGAPDDVAAAVRVEQHARFVDPGGPDVLGRDAADNRRRHRRPLGRRRVGEREREAPADRRPRRGRGKEPLAEEANAGTQCRGWEADLHRPRLWRRRHAPLPFPSAAACWSANSRSCSRA